jgi:geranylgeranyl diphosphate synthase type II
MSKACTNERGGDAGGCNAPAERATRAADTAREPGVSAGFAGWLETARADADAALSIHLKYCETRFGPHSRLGDAVQYSVRLGGKRIRPVLVLESCRVCGGRSENARAAAVAIECVHTFSLIHDDLPAMDNDDFRRGQPTNHRVFGEGLAVLAGDWLVTHAFEVLAAEQEDRRTAAALLAALADGTRRMIEGQAADIAGEKQPTDPELVRYIHAHKTAALLETCCRLGALCAGASPERLELLVGYGRHLGLAFQIMDDVLDVTSSSEKLGKRAGKDAAAAKQTYPAAFGLEESRRQARREAEAAVSALTSFGDQADHLRDLAWYVVTRDR